MDHKIWESIYFEHSTELDAACRDVNEATQVPLEQIPHQDVPGHDTPSSVVGLPVVNSRYHPKLYHDPTTHSQQLLHDLPLVHMKANGADHGHRQP